MKIKLKTRAFYIPVLAVLVLTGCDNLQKVVQSVKDLQTEDAIQPTQDIVADWRVRLCELSYKGQPLVLGTPIVEWEKVLGQHDRFVNEIYVFDKYGLKLYEREKVITEVNLHYKNRANYTEEEINRYGKESTRDSRRRSNAARPKQVYTGSIDVDGGIVTPNINIGTFNQQRLDLNPENKELTKGYLPTIYHLYYYCDNALIERAGVRIDTQTPNNKEVRVFSMGRG